LAFFGESGQLSTLWNRCVADLSNYSRAISKPLATVQLRVNAWRALPAEFRLPATSPVFDRFTQIIGRAQAFDGYRIMKVGLLAQLIGIARCERLRDLASSDGSMTEVIPHSSCTQGMR
jgi:hypothetical protein